MDAGKRQAIAARWSAARLAGFACLVPVATIAGCAYTLLFVAARPGADKGAMLHALFLQDPQRAVFWELALLLAACPALAAGYLAGAAQSLSGALALAVALVALALAAAFTLDASIAATVALPLVFVIPDIAARLARRPRRRA